MRKLLNNISLDLKISSRNWFLVITIVLAILYSLIINFLIPAKFEIPQTGIVFLDLTSDKSWESLFILSDEKAVIASSEENLIEILKKTGSIGITFREESAVVTFQGYEDQKVQDLIKETVSNFYYMRTPEGAQNKVEIEEIGKSSGFLPFNIKTIPLLMATDIVLLGFMFIGVMFFNEQKEKSIYAYRMTSAGAFTYLLSKVLVNTLLSLIFGFLFIILTGQFGIDFFQFFILIFLASFIMSTIGILIGQFFGSLSEFLPALLGVLLIGMLPAIQFFNPLISVDLFKIIPSYPVMYGTQTLLLGNGSIWREFLIPLIEIIILFPLTCFIIKKRILKK